MRSLKATGYVGRGVWHFEFAELEYRELVKLRVVSRSKQWDTLTYVVGGNKQGLRLRRNKMSKGADSEKIQLPKWTDFLV